MEKSDKLLIDYESNEEAREFMVRKCGSICEWDEHYPVRPHNFRMTVESKELEGENVVLTAYIKRNKQLSTIVYNKGDVKVVNLNDWTVNAYFPDGKVVASLTKEELD